MPVAVRITWMKEADRQPLLHRATVVTLERKQYLCDVGYGGPGPKGLVDPSEQMGNMRFRENGYQVVTGAAVVYWMDTAVIEEALPRGIP